MNEQNYFWISCISTLSWLFYFFRVIEFKSHWFKQVVGAIILGMFSLVLGFLWPLILLVLFLSIPDICEVLDKAMKERRRKT